jgi:hypothetical protein
MRRQWLPVAVLVGVTLLGGVAHAGSDPAAVQGTVLAPSAPIQSEVPLVLSIRALSLGQTPFTETGEMERVRDLDRARRVPQRDAWVHSGGRRTPAPQRSPPIAPRRVLSPGGPLPFPRACLRLLA